MGSPLGQSQFTHLRFVGISPTSWGWGGWPLGPWGRDILHCLDKGWRHFTSAQSLRHLAKAFLSFCTLRERAWESRSESGILRLRGWFAAELTQSNTSYYYSCWQLFAIVDSYLFFTTYWRQKLNQCSQIHLGNLNGSRYFFIVLKTRVELSYFLGYWPSWPCSDHWDCHCLGGKRLTNLLE